MIDKQTVTISIPGEPKTKKRPRFSRVGSKVRTYNSTKESDDTLRWQMKARLKGTEPLSGALHVAMIFVFKRPKSRAKLKEVYHTITPDIDNLLKQYLDVGNAILWYDDQQIASVSAIKIYGDVASTVIIVRKLNDS